MLGTALASALAIPSNPFLHRLVIITNGPPLASTEFPTGLSIPQMSGPHGVCRKNHHPTVIVCAFHYQAGTKNEKLKLRKTRHKTWGVVTSWKRRDNNRERK